MPGLAPGIFIWKELLVKDRTIPAYKKDYPRREFDMARVALVTGGTRGIGAAISKALKAAGYKVAASYAGNDAAAEKFKAETGIPVYKWDVSSFDACAAGVKKVEADLGPVDVLDQQCRHHQGRRVPQDDARAVECRDQHQSRFAVQHDAPGDRGHARPEIRPRHHRSPRSTARRASSARSIIPRPRPATSASPRRWRWRTPRAASPST